MSATPDGLAGSRTREIRIDVIGDKAGHSLVAEHILDQPGNKGDGPAGARRTDCLVRPFTPSGFGKFSAENRFSRFGDALDLNDHVGVRTAYDEYRIIRHKGSKVISWLKRLIL